MSGAVIGVWCGASPADLLAPIAQPGEEQVPLLRVILARCVSIKHTGHPLTVLIPWLPSYDPLAADIKFWGYTLRRTYPDERIAMRDLVAERSADFGVLVYGTAGTIDVAEILLALERLRRGVGDRAVKNARLVVLPAEVWLLPNVDDEWVEPMTARDLSLFYAGQNIKSIHLLEARALRARKDSR